MIEICLTPISKLEILFAMLTDITGKLDYGVTVVMKYQFSMAWLVKNLSENFKYDKRRILPCSIYKANGIKLY